MHKLDEDITRAYFRLEEAQRQRLWLQRIWHPELFDWRKRGGPPPMTESKRIRQEELSRLGFGEARYQEMKAAEAQALAELESLAELHPLWPYFEAIRGLSRYLCGAFVAAAGDITRTPTVSAFWYGMGLDVLPHGMYTDSGKEIFPPGAVPRRIRGSVGVERKVPALPHVTRVGEQIRQQFVRTRGKLSWWYYHFKEQEPPDKVRMFRHKSALRKTQKLLYACLWREWRLSRGLPAPDPYAFAILKHNGRMVRIQDFFEDGTA